MKRATWVFLGTFLAALATAPAGLSAPPKPAAARDKKPVDPIRQEINDLLGQASRLVPEFYTMPPNREATPPDEKLDGAIAIYEKVVTLEEKLSGADSETVTMRLTMLAFLLRKRGLHARALAAHERVLAIAEKHASSPLKLWAPLEEVAGAAARAGRYERSFEVYERLLSTLEKKYGAESFPVATTLEALAGALESSGDHARALAKLDEGVRILEKNPKQWGSSCKDCVASLSRMLRTMAEIHVALGHYDKAKPLLARSLENERNSPNGPALTSTLVASARLAGELGDYRGAEALLSEAIEVETKNAGAASPGVASVLAVLGRIKGKRGDLLGAEGVLNDAIQILEKATKATGDVNPTMIAAKTALGEVFTQKGDHSRAERVLHEALGGSEKALGPDAASTAEVLGALAELHRREGDLPRAEGYAARALEIVEKRLGADNHEAISARVTLARLKEARGDVESARALHERALAAREKVLGKDHPDTARSILDLAELHRREARFDKADPLYRRALEVAERALGPDHPLCAAVLEGRAALLAAHGDVSAAIPLQSRAADILEHDVYLVLGSGSEVQKRDYMATLAASSDFTIDLHLSLAPKDAAAERLALTTILQRKGRILDVMADTLASARRRAGEHDKPLLYDLEAARARYAATALRGPSAEGKEEHARALVEMQGEVERLEERLGKNGAKLVEQETPATIERVRAAMPDESTLVELFVYRPRESTERGAAPRWGAPHVGAYTLTPKGKMSSMDLGETAPIERAVTELRKAIQSRDPEDEARLARKLDEMVMRPLRGSLGDAVRILISPDGALHLIPFAALIDEHGRRLVERYQFTYLTSGRDLLRLQFHARHRSPPVIVANPAFGRAAFAPALDAAPRDRSAALGRTTFPPLPGTAGEARALAALLPEAKVLVDTEATEAALKAVEAPRILHVATHGYFLANQRVVSSESRGLVLDMGAEAPASEMRGENPLLRSGLALSGANGRKSGDEDGILTALEAAGLDLYGTKLVVLSACETGLGDVQNGDGVLGLRRAFLLAGAETQMVSLWTVADEQTRDLMIGYYDRLRRGGGRSESLREVQLAMLSRPETAAPYYWAPFLVSGDGSPLGAADAAESPPKVASPPPVVVTRGCACSVSEQGDGALSAFAGALALALWAARRRTVRSSS